MLSEPLRRTNFDHGSGTNAQDHHQDYTELHEPLARMEHLNFFDWGIVQGLHVTGTIGATELAVQAGVAIDREGRLISLSEDGLADIGANPLAIPPQSQEAPVPVTLSTTGHEDQTAFVTIQFSEFFSSSPTDPFDPGDYEQRPWIRLQDVSLFDPVTGGLILARVTIDTTGNITSIHGQDRQMLQTSLGQLRLRKGQAAGPANGAYDIAEEVTVELDGATADINVGGSGQAGDIRVRNSSGDPTIHMDGATGDIALGGGGQAGNLEVRNSGGNPTAQMDGASADFMLGGSGQDGNLNIRNASGAPTAQINGATGDLTLGGAGQDGDITLNNSSGSPTVRLDGASGDFTLGGGGQEGDIRVQDGLGRQVLHVDGSNAILYIGTNGNTGDLQIRDLVGRTVMNFAGSTATLHVGTTGNGGNLRVRDSSGRTVMNFNGNGASLSIGANGNEGDLQIRDGSGRTVFNFDSNNAALYLGASGNEGDLQIRDGSNRTVFNFDSNNAALYLGASGNEGDLQIRDGSNRTVFNFDSNNAALYLGASGNEGDLQIRNNSGSTTINLDGNTGRIRSNGRLIAGNPTRYVTTRWLVADNGTVTSEVDLGSTRQVYAFVNMVGTDPRHDFDSGDAFAVDIFRIDGNVTSTWRFGGSHFGSNGSNNNLKRPEFRGSARRILFRARSFQDASVFAIGTVFYE